jgi:hypothetical protein
MYSISIQHQQIDPALEQFILQDLQPHLNKIAEENFEIARIELDISPYTPILITVQVCNIRNEGIFHQRQAKLFQFRLKTPQNQPIAYYVTFVEA